MNKVTTISETRNQLKRFSSQARKLRLEKMENLTVNQVLLTHIYNTNGATTFHTFNEWRKRGYTVMRGEKAYVVWGKPQKQKVDKNSDDEYSFYPVTYLFSDKQVMILSDSANTASDSLASYNPTYKGEFKISYTRKKENPCKVVNSKQVVDFLRQIWEDDISYRERFVVIALNSALKISGYTMLSSGNITSVPVDKRLLSQFLLLSNAVSFIVAHNHPSGETTPSREDIELTNNIKKVGELLQIQLLDHVILTDEEDYSFVENMNF
ncbi:MAG: JAB domain-containing protein [Marinifilaceae bacterium]